MKCCYVKPLLIATVFHVIKFGACDFPQLHRALPAMNGKPYRSVSRKLHTADTDTVDKNDPQLHLNRKEKVTRVMDAEVRGNAGSTTEAWVYSILSSIVVGLSGIFPLLVIPLDAGPALRHGPGAARLKLLLSFAVGGLLGDVFLHLLPEAWASIGKDDHWQHISVGMWVIGGLLLFMIVEKIFSSEEDLQPMGDSSDEDQSEEEQHDSKSSAVPQVNGVANGKCNGATNGELKHRGGTTAAPSERTISKKNENGSVAPKASGHIKVTGYLNLMANCIDNFTHGLAVAGSYLVSPKMGVCTTIAILLHEIPHEIGDFAILLRSGFDRWGAAKAQVWTAAGGLIGALAALAADSAPAFGDATAWILPFTAGGFLYIALVTVVPDLTKEKHPWESLKQIICLVSGIGSLMFVTYFFE